MSDKTGIEWTDATWNPVTGCTEVSPGCDHCYAKTFAGRFRGVPGHHFEQGFDVVLRPEKLDLPLRWRKPKRVFVNSMSDLFHDEVPDEYIAQVFAVMACSPQHTFQVLTKRHGRMRSLLGRADFLEMISSTITSWYVWPPSPKHYALAGGSDWYGEAGTWPLPNVWLGVSVENQQWADIRVPALVGTPAAVRFLSCEPLLGPVDLSHWLKHTPECDASEAPWCVCHRHRDGDPYYYVDQIDWVIVGGESGRGARPMQMQWARSLRDQCQTAGVPFMFKQWGEYGPANATDDPDMVIRLGKGKAGRELDGRTWDEFPATRTEVSA